MKMSQELIKAIENSPVWKQATIAMNSVVEQANREGKKLTQKERDELQELRVLSTLAMDSKVKKIYSDELFKATYKNN